MSVSANPVMKFNARQTIAVDGANSIEIENTEIDRGPVAYDADSDPETISDEIAAQILDYEEGKPLRNTVDRGKGY